MMRTLAVVICLAMIAGSLFVTGITAAAENKEEIQMDNPSPEKSLPDRSGSDLGDWHSRNFLSDVEWARRLPRIWTGEYDGDNGHQSIRRKYALQITNISGEDIEGLAYVDKGTTNLEYQVRVSYRFSGTINYGSHSLTWKGTNLIEGDDFGFLEFYVDVDSDMTTMTGTTDSEFGGTVDLVAATGASSLVNWNYAEDDEFLYDPNEMSLELANECITLSMLVYGNSGEYGRSYIRRNDYGHKPLFSRLDTEGFTDVSSFKGLANANVKDGIHYVTAHKTLKDGSELLLEWE